MPNRIVLDTNIIISALLFGGTPRKIFLKALKKDFVCVTSPTLLAELADILSKKFDFSKDKIEIIQRKLQKKFFIVSPTISIHILADEPDNRVLEAAVAGKCDIIVTGDRKLLEQKIYKGIRIMTVQKAIELV
jgi:uncharacterized protein